MERREKSSKSMLETINIKSQQKRVHWDSDTNRNSYVSQGTRLCI